MNEVTAEDIDAVLADGPLAEDELGAAVARRLGAGSEEDEDRIDAQLWEVVDPSRVVELDDERVASRAWLLGGFVAWHRLDADEVANRGVDFGVDGVFHLSIGAPERVVIGDEGAEVEAELFGAGSFLLPDGWEPDLAEGDVVGLVLDGDRLRLVRPGPADELAEGPDDAGDVTALRDAIEDLGRKESVALTPGAEPRNDWILDLEEAAADLLVAAGPLLAGLRVPFGEAIAATGLKSMDRVVAGDGLSEERFAIYAVGWRLISMTRRWDAVPSPESVGLLWFALTSPAEALRPELAEIASRFLDDAAAVGVVADHVSGLADDETADIADRLREFADETGVGAAWLLASTEMARGDVEAAFGLLTGAAAAHPPASGDGWDEVWEELGSFLAVAGDVEAAQRTWRAAGAPERAVHLDRWRPVPPTGVGRNDPCPCGSGRKFKQCCQRHPQPLGLAGRASFAQWKVQTWAMDRHRGCVPELDFDLGMHAIDLFVLSLHAHLLEGGAMSELVAQMGGLLPDDERELIESWADARHRLYRVERFSPDGELRLRDASGEGDGDEPGGDVLTVAADLGPLHELRPKGHLLGAVLDTPGGPLLAGLPVAVPDEDVDRVRAALAADPGEEDLYALVRSMLHAHAH
ncbi:MAG: hypothetical protein GXY13_12740 [Acidimicrobiales bacterium]|nr:hypothetical protein [Acidimicrobiales bacterium]